MRVWSVHAELTRKRNMNRHGFTIIELIVILVIIGIVATAVMVSGSPKGPVRLHAACQKLATDLRYMQEVAMAQQVRFGVSFNPGDRSYFGYRINTSTKATDPQTQGNLEIKFDTTREFKEIQIAGTNFNNAVEFDSAGRPYNGSGVLLSSQGIVTLSDGTNTRTVTIEAVTGKVSIQ